MEICKFGMTSAHCSDLDNESFTCMKNHESCFFLDETVSPTTLCVREEIVKCPFCGEDDFDLPGLKGHLVIFGCVVFEDLNPFEINDA